MTAPILLIICLLASIDNSRACYLNLVIGGGGGGPAAKSIEDLAESAPAVLTGRVLAVSPNSRTGAVSKRRHSAEIQIVEVLKGLALLFPSGNRSDAERRILVHGFGDPVSCLSEVFPDEWLIFFLSKSGSSLVAHYASPSAAVAQLTESNLARVNAALGWYSWSSWTLCSQNCGTTGVRERARNCAGPPCDYGDAEQAVPCNRWPCTAMRQAELSNLSGTNESVAVAINGKLLPLSGNMSLALNFSPSSPEIRVDLETITKDVINIVSLTDLHSLWTKMSNPLAVWVYLRFVFPDSNGSSIEFSVDCSSSGRVPVGGVSGSKLVITPAKLLKSANFVPWLAATNCSDIKKLTPPPTYWTTWSSCSATCGEGIRTRHSVCRASSVPPSASSCPPAGSRSGSESRPCPSLPLCNPDHSSEANAGCGCLNGGFCFESRCICPTSHMGSRCQTVVVEAPATEPTQLKHPPPTPPTSLPSRRRFNKKFDCRRQQFNRRGRLRRRRKGSADVCRNGGVCDPRLGGHCRCPMGWTGRRCRKPQCRPKCRNGGACVSPNLCACAPGYSGTQCEKVDCYPPCVNGGTCMQPGKCACPPGYRGRFCHRVRCHRSLCLNGGRCREADGLCRCRAGFYGARCERRNCTPELSYRKTYRPVVKRLRRPTVQPCSPGSKRYCLLSSYTRVLVFKIVLRPYFTCSTV